MCLPRFARLFSEIFIPSIRCIHFGRGSRLVEKVRERQTLELPLIQGGAPTGLPQHEEKRLHDLWDLPEVTESARACRYYSVRRGSC